MTLKLVVVKDNASVTSGDTEKILLYHIKDIEIFGTATVGSPSTITFQRSIDNVNFYDTETITVNSGVDFYGKFECVAPYAQIRFDANMTGLSLSYAAL